MVHLLRVLSIFRSAVPPEVSMAEGSAHASIGIVFNAQGNKHLFM